MKQAIGCALVVAGIAAALWAGGWWAFVGGIAQVVDALQAYPVNGVAIGLGLLRVILAGAIGAVVGFVPIWPGILMIKDER